MKLPEELRVKLIILASENHVGVRGKHPIEVLMGFRDKQLSKEDEETVKEICKFFDADYDRVRGRKK